MNIKSDDLYEHHFPVKMNKTLNTEKTKPEKSFCVYEWYIVETGQVFFIGKGKADLRKKGERNSYFNRIVEQFDCNVRLVKEQLTEYEALMLEGELSIIREQEGHVLVNRASRDLYGKKVKYEYMKTPKILTSQIDKAYFGIEELNFDAVNKDKLLNTCLPKHSLYGVGQLYIHSDEEFISQERCEEAMKPLVEEMTEKIEAMGGRVYKMPVQSTTSVILSCAISYDSYLAYKQKGYDVYHLLDVIAYLRGN